MSKAKEAAMKAYPKRKDGRVRYFNCTDDDIRRLYAQGYKKASKNIKEELLEWAKVQKEKVGIGLAEYDMGKENGKLEVLNALIEKIKEL